MIRTLTSRNYITESKFIMARSLLCDLFLKKPSNLSQTYRSFSKSIVMKKEPDPGIKLKEKEWQLEFNQIEPDSPMKMYDCKPFKLKVVKGKKYSWCSCGFSNSQPLCDGSHKIREFKITLRPVVFKAPETTSIWLCNCKKTKNRPFCDGSHRSKEVQDAFEKIV